MKWRIYTLCIGAKLHNPYGFGEPSVPIWLDDLQCNGLENNLLNCTSERTHSCGHSQDVGIMCLPGKKTYICILKCSTHSVFILKQTALLESSGSLVEVVLMREELRYAIVASGALFVMRDGRTEMQKWCVARLDSELVVRVFVQRNQTDTRVSCTRGQLPPLAI